MSRARLLALALTAAVVIAAACGGPRSAILDDGSAPSGSQPLGGAQTGRAVVTRVVDGDTAVLDTIGKSRFIGVDTPEVYGRAECFGPEASAYAKRLLDGATVRYEVGREPRDRYGRALVYIWLEDGRFFNELLVSQGYARPLTIAPNVEHAGLFRRRASEARASGRGLWAQAACG